MLNLIQLTSDKDDYSFFEWLDTQELLFMWTGDIFSWPIRPADLMTYVNRIRKKELVSLNFYNSSGVLVGHCDIDNISERHKRGEMTRVVILPQFRNSGIGQQMVSEVVKFTFEKLNLHRLELKVFDFNKNAIRCYEKVGFNIEGLLKDFLYDRGKFWNLYVMSMINNVTT